MINIYGTLKKWFLSINKNNDFSRGKKEPDWKDNAIEDFRQWLDELPENSNEKRGKDYLESCDLFTLLSEFASLKQEIKNQNKRHSKTIKQLDSFFDKSKNIMEKTAHFSGELENLYDKISRDSEERVIKKFLDIRDPLERGLEASEKVSQKRSFFTGRSGAGGLHKGYDIALKKFDRILSEFDVSVIQCKGKKFDPSLMEAYEVVKGKETGIVESVISSGYVRKEKILKIARVVVNK